MTKAADDQQRKHEAHMDGVRAVQRRSAYNRIVDKIAVLKTWAHQTTTGNLIRNDGSEIDEIGKHNLEELKYLIEIRDMLRKELIQYGQIKADPDPQVS